MSFGMIFSSLNVCTKANNFIFFHNDGTDGWIRTRMPSCFCGQFYGKPHILFIIQRRYPLIIEQKSSESNLRGLMTEYVVSRQHLALGRTCILYGMIDT